MRMLFPRISKPLALSFAFAFATACTTSPEQEAAQAEAQAKQDAEIAARKGDAVSRFCPRPNDGWQAFGDDMILMEGGTDWYLVELLGTCDPEGAFNAIATRSPVGSSCIERGDDVYTGRPRAGERCVITAIYAWDKSAQLD